MLRKVNEKADNVEYIGFKHWCPELREHMIVLVPPHKADDYSEATGEWVSKVYWKNGKWSYAGNKRIVDRRIAQLWVGAGMMNGLFLFEQERV